MGAHLRADTAVGARRPTWREHLALGLVEPRRRGLGAPPWSNTQEVQGFTRTPWASCFIACITVGYSDCLPALSNHLAERAAFSQVPKLLQETPPELLGRPAPGYAFARAAGAGRGVDGMVGRGARSLCRFVPLLSHFVQIYALLQIRWLPF